MRESDPQMMAKSNIKFKFKQTAWGVALLCAITSASAITIDRAAGSIVLGRPLDLTVKVTVAPDEELTSLCAVADVTYGDVQQDPARVSVSTEPASSPNTLNVRVRSSNPVDEPVVTLEVKAGCKQTVSRRFVMLSDLAADIQRPVVAPTAPVTKTVQSVVVKPKVPDTPVVATISPTDVDVASIPSPQALSKKPAPVASVVRVKPKSSVVTPTTNNPPAEQRSRLRLAPIDLSQDWEPILQATSEMLSVPAEDLNKRREAAALWRYLNLSPKDILRVNSQEDELNKLKLTMAKSQQQMQELNQQLVTAEEQRYANPLVYSLVGLILLMLGGAGYLYYRTGGRGLPNAQWWKTLNAANEFRPSEFSEAEDGVAAESKSVLPVAASPEAGLDAAVKPAATEVKKKARIPVQAEVVAAVPVEAQESKLPEVPDELDFELDVEPEAAPEPEAPIQHKDFEHSLSGAMRSINTHDMLDVRQQAEFFMTLGQCEDAIDMLQNSIHQSDAANPLVYLDLIKMLHTLSRKTEFDSIRKDFNRIFSGRVPPYIAFNEPSKGLDNYHDLCERLVATWPHKSAIEFIEQCLVRGTPHAQTGRLELEAFRDLLMLHDIAKQFDDSGEAQSYSFSAAKTDLGMMADFADSEPIMLEMPKPEVSEPVAVAPDLLLPPTFDGQSSAEVDLDLSEPKDNLIDFDPSIFSLDLPETKNS